ncbi:MAG: hypothetical protein Q8L47_00215 [bacterium]|nr:hypothetical protein [bacterium]
MIKGEHGRGFTNTSVIMRVYNSGSAEKSAGGIVAEYLNGEWELNPGEISKKLEIVRPSEE